jgi:hypothetical protein
LLQLHENTPGFLETAPIIKNKVAHCSTPKKQLRESDDDAGNSGILGHVQHHNSSYKPHKKLKSPELL